MHQDILKDLTAALKNDYGFKKKGKWLREGECPSCSKKELYTHADGPWVIKCGRPVKCGWESSIKELYPEIFEGFNKRYPETPENPNATADAFMAMSRGFDIGLIDGWYEQGKFWHPDADKGTATVRFYLDKEAGIHMERFCEQVTITDPDTGEKKKRKAHFKGSHAGLWWEPPGLEIEDGDEVWLAEGCLDAIGLMLNGAKAVSTLSCVNYPKKKLEEHKGKQVTWMWALDNDKAGRDYIKKHVKKMREAGLNVGAALPPAYGKKQDWNDLHQAGRLEEENLKYYRYLGALLIAQSAEEKALLMYEHKGRREFPFEFNNRTYWFHLNLTKFDKAMAKPGGGDEEEGEKKADLYKDLSEEEIRQLALKSASSITPIANCAIRFLYYQENQLTDESWYYARVTFPHGGMARKNTFTGGQLAGASEFAKRLISMAAGAVWTGSSTQLNRIKEDQLYGIKTVQTVDYVGYSKEYDCYVFSDIAVKDGQTIRLNDEDFFDVGKISIKSLNRSINLNVNPALEKFRPDTIELIYKAFGPHGIASAVFWFGSLFAEQIRATQKTFPFFEAVGEPGSGKSTLIEYLWKLVGRFDYEGFDPSKSTLAARARIFAQVSNLPISLIESEREDDRAKSGRFDWDELKTAYNGRSVRARGIKSTGNEVYEPPFRGAIVISQNDPVNASDAMLQRIVHINITKAGHNPETRKAAGVMETMAIEEVSGFLLKSVAKEKEVMKIVNEMAPKYEAALMGLEEIKNVRIAKNHSQLKALLDAMGKVFSLPEDMVLETHTTLDDMAVERQKAINMDHPTVTDFWETFEYLEELKDLNHSKDDELIAVNLNHFVKVASTNNQQIPLLSDLKRHLKTSRHRKYIGQKSVNSGIWVGGSVESKAKTVRCWIFQAAK